MSSNNKIVYYNGITNLEAEEHKRNSTQQFKKKSKSLKCSNCAWSTIGARKHPNIIYTMKRIYIKNKNSWKPIGWYCEHCGSVVLDKIKKPSFGYFKPPDPTIKVLKIEYTNY